MRGAKASLLYVTDLYYKAQGRAYYTEDVYITSRLKNDFDILICHPLHTKAFEKIADLVVIRNSGATIHYQNYFKAFVERVHHANIKTYNSLQGRADMKGKDYLVQLTKAGYPVIPAIDDIHHLQHLPAANRYIMKPKEGADSIGLKIVDKAAVQHEAAAGMLIQPFIDFRYEVSFYFIDAVFQYALYAPDKNKRWQLQRYTPTAADLTFAQQFIDWNTITHGIQRVDVCRTNDGNLLLVELEDLNPFLSLELLDETTKASFIQNFKTALLKQIEG